MIYSQNEKFDIKMIKCTAWEIKTTSITTLSQIACDCKSQTCTFTYFLLFYESLSHQLFFNEIWKHATDFAVNVHYQCLLLLILLKRYTNGDLKFANYFTYT